MPPPPPELLLPLQPTADKINATVMRVRATVNLLRPAGIPKTSTPAKTAPPPPSHKGALLGPNPAAAVVMLSVTDPLGVPLLRVKGLPLTEQAIFAEVGAVQVKVITPL